MMEYLLWWYLYRHSRVKHKNNISVLSLMLCIEIIFYQDTESFHEKWKTLQNTISRTKKWIGKYTLQDMNNYHYRWGFKYRIIVSKLFCKIDYKQFLLRILNSSAPYFMLCINNIKVNGSTPSLMLSI